LNKKLGRRSQAGETTDKVQVPSGRTQGTNHKHPKPPRGHVCGHDKRIPTSGLQKKFCNLAYAKTKNKKRIKEKEKREQAEIGGNREDGQGVKEVGQQKKSCIEKGPAKTGLPRSGGGKKKRNADAGAASGERQKQKKKESPKERNSKSGKKPWSTMSRQRAGRE